MLVNCQSKHNHTSKNWISSFRLKWLDVCNLLSRVQTLWTGTSTVQYGVAAIQLEFIINGFQSLCSVLVTAVTYPPANSIKDNTSGFSCKQNQKKSQYFSPLKQWPLDKNIWPTRVNNLPYLNSLNVSNKSI